MADLPRVDVVLYADLKVNECVIVDENMGLEIHETADKNSAQARINMLLEHQMNQQLTSSKASVIMTPFLVVRGLACCAAAADAPNVPKDGPTFGGGRPFVVVAEFAVPF